jgi:pimeloyl-ACP methyl ester carboxylesterase
MGARRRKEYRVKVGDVELSYLVDGHPSAPPLVLLHALSMNARDWSRVSLLLGQQFRVYSLNFRGHGGSGWAPTYAFKDLATEVVGFLDALGIDRAAVVGHALGGIVATFVAAMFPNRVSALVVEEGPPPRIGGPRMAFGEMGLPGVAYDRLALLQVADQMNHPDGTWARMGLRIRAPTLVIGGGPLSHIPEEWNMELAATIAGGRFVRIPAGHFIHKRRMAEFVAQVWTFLEGQLLRSTSVPRTPAGP